MFVEERYGTDRPEMAFAEACLFTRRERRSAEYGAGDAGAQTPAGCEGASLN